MDVGRQPLTQRGITAAASGHSGLGSAPAAIASATGIACSAA